MHESRCGILCSQCEYKESMNCGGCLAIDKPFWSDSCPVMDCCKGRGHDHCGKCSELPCELLNEFAYDKEQGDNGLRIEHCRSWANYENHGIGACELIANEVIAVLEKEKTLVFATSEDNRITIRTMSHVNEGLTVYFQTGEHYLKTQQIRANPKVAMSVGSVDIEGVAEIIGHPMDTANESVLNKLRRKHPNAVERWSSLPNQVIVKIEIQTARQWRYVDDKPVIATFVRK